MKFNDITRYDLEYITEFALIQRMKNLDSLIMHDFLTSLESFFPVYSDKFLEKLKANFKTNINLTDVNKRAFIDSINLIEKELENRKN